MCLDYLSKCAATTSCVWCCCSWRARTPRVVRPCWRCTPACGVSILSEWGYGIEFSSCPGYSAIWWASTGFELFCSSLWVLWVACIVSYGRDSNVADRRNSAYSDNVGAFATAALPTVVPFLYTLCPRVLCLGSCSRVPYRMMCLATLAATSCVF